MLQHTTLINYHLHQLMTGTTANNYTQPLIQGYHISSIRHYGYYFFLLFILVWLLFEGGIYFVGKSADSNDG